MPLSPADRQRWQTLADAVVPGATIEATSTVAHGESHEVLVLPGVAVIRVARSEQAAALMPRRLRLLERLDDLGLPFQVPVPLSGAVVVGGVSASALSYVPGQPRERRSGGADELRRLMAALGSVDVDALVGELDVPHAYAGRERWAEMLIDEVLPRLPADVQPEALHRVVAAVALPAARKVLVHGDLAGANMLWHPDGGLSGVLDWDLACAFDPAVDAACLAWFGWETVESIVDAQTFRRARTWFAVFGLEQVSAALVDLRPEPEIEEVVVRAAQWIRRTSL